MQICRSSNLTFLVSAVLFCSIAVAMVAAAPVPASASSYGLEQHPAGDFVKRMGPEGIEALKGMSAGELAQLLAYKEAQAKRFAEVRELVEKGELKGPAGEWLDMSISELAIKEAHQDIAAVKAQMKKFGEDLSLGRPSSSS